MIVAVRERAVDGAATGAVLRALAEALGVPRSAVTLRSGAAARDKLVTVHKPPSDLDVRLARLMDAGP